MNLATRVILKEDSPEAGDRHDERVIRVLIADDQELVRTGFRVILETEGDIEVVAEAVNGREAIRQAALVKPDVVLMDIRMPELDGLAATEEILRQPEPPTIVVLTTFDQNEYIYRALRAGAAGFLLKDTPPAEIVRAIELVDAGDSMLSPAVTRRLIDHVAAAGETGTPRADADRLLATLSPRELEVARAVGRGLANAEISAELHLSVATVKAHVSKVMEKLDVDNRVQVALLIRDGSPPGAAPVSSSRAG